MTASPGHAPSLPMDLPSFPVDRDGSLPPVILLLRWLASLPTTADAIELTDLPSLNGSIPGLLRLGDIARVIMRQRLSVPHFAWEGLGGGQVVVNDPGDDSLDLPLHHGGLPSASWPTHEIAGDVGPLVELARLIEAQSLHGQSAGVTWDALISIATGHGTVEVPSLRDQNQRSDGGFGVWNPLPFARRGVVAWAAPSNRTSQALFHHPSGAAYPTQIVAGPSGQEVLVELALPGLSAQRLQPHQESVAGVAWEVNGKVLDNGLVRAELDVHGQIERLCFSGHFVDLAGPLAYPAIHGLPLSDHPAEIRVLEDGPVRARIIVSRNTHLGALHLTYTLHAHESLLHIAVAWDGAANAELMIDHPTHLRHHPLRVAGELTSELRRHHPSALESPATPINGCRWAILDDGHGGGLAMLSPRPLTVHAANGHLSLPCASHISYALGDPGVIDIARAAVALAVPLRAFHGNIDLISPFRLAGGAGVAPLWARSVDGASELTVAEQYNRRSRLWIFPISRPTAAWRSDVRGKSLGKVTLTPEGDALQVDLHPGELALIRWL